MEILILVAVLAASAWGFVYLRWTGLWGIMLATMIVGTIFGHPFFNAGPVTLDRLMLGGCLAIYIAYRKLNKLQLKRWLAADSLFVAFIAMMLLTTFRGDWKADSGAPVTRLLFFYLLPVIAYWIGRQTELTPQRIRIFYAVFGVLGLYLSVTAFFEKFDLHGLVFPRYIVNPKFAEFFGRGRGPLLNPSGNGVLLIFGLACGLMAMAYYRKWGRTLVASTVPVHLLGIYCTMTRCVWMGGAAVLGGLMYVCLPKNYRIPFLIAATMSVGLVIAAKSESLKSFKRDKNVSEKYMRQSAELRPLLAMFAWKIFEEHPVFGCGTAQYRKQALEYLNERDVDMQLVMAKGYVQHNIFLAILTENGLISLVPYVGLLALWSYWALRLWLRRNLAIEHRQFGLVFLSFMMGYITIGMFQDVLIMPMITMYLFLLGGCLRNLCEVHLFYPNATVERRRASDHVPRRVADTRPATGWSSSPA
jgi:hypothetical protein